MAISLGFETARLRLKPAELSDAAFFLELMNTPKWVKYIGDRKVKTKEEAETYIQTKMLPQYIEKGFGNYVIILKKDNVKIGTCGLYDRPGLDGIDVGYALLPAFENKGYTVEAVEHLLELANGKFNLKQVNAITTLDNSASIKLLEKLAFTKVKQFKMEGDAEELYLYSKNIVKNNK